MLNLEDVGSYGMSCFYKKKDAKNMLALFTKRNPRAIASKGITACECGPIQRTNERKKTSKSHVDWWLYEGAKPHLFFEKVDIYGL